MWFSQYLNFGKFCSRGGCCLRNVQTRRKGGTTWEVLTCTWHECTFSFLHLMCCIIVHCTFIVMHVFKCLEMCLNVLKCVAVTAPHSIYNTHYSTLIVQLLFQISIYLILLMLFWNSIWVLLLMAFCISCKSPLLCNGTWSIANSAMAPWSAFSLYVLCSRFCSFPLTF